LAVVLIGSSPPPLPSAGADEHFPRHRGKKKQRCARKLFLFVRKSLIRKLLGSFRKSQIRPFVMIGALVRKSEIRNPKMCGFADLRFTELICGLFTFEKKLKKVETASNTNSEQVRGCWTRIRRQQKKKDYLIQSLFCLIQRAL
jgi:hypothetical protein